MPTIKVFDVNSLYPNLMVANNILDVYGFVSGSNIKNEEKYLQELLCIETNNEADLSYWNNFAKGRFAGRIFGTLFWFGLYDEIVKYKWFITTKRFTNHEMNGQDLLDLIQNKNIIVTPNGLLTNGNQLSILLEKTLVEWIKMRDTYKAKAKQGDQVADLIQNATKLAMNSMYGVFGTDSFPFYNIYIAEAITITGQYISLTTSALINHYIQTKNINDLSVNINDFINARKKFDANTQFIMYNDTDSFFVYDKYDILHEDVLNNSILPLVYTYAHRFATNTYKQKVLPHYPKVKLEFVGESAFGTGVKKRYFLYNSQTDEYKLAGFLNRQNPDFLNEYLINLFKRICRGEVKLTMLEYIIKTELISMLKDYNANLDLATLRDISGMVAWKTATLTNNDLISILKAAKNRSEVEKILKSIAPHIFGMLLYNLIVGPVFSYGSRGLSLKGKYSLKFLNELSDKLRQHLPLDIVMLVVNKAKNASVIVVEDSDEAINFVQNYVVGLEQEYVNKFVKSIKDML